MREKPRPAEDTCGVGARHTRRPATRRVQQERCRFQVPPASFLSIGPQMNIVSARGLLYRQAAEKLRTIHEITQSSTKRATSASHFVCLRGSSYPAAERATLLQQPAQRREVMIHQAPKILLAFASVVALLSIGLRRIPDTERNRRQALNSHYMVMTVMDGRVVYEGLLLLALPSSQIWRYSK